MKTLLIVYHTGGVKTATMAEAVERKKQGRLKKVIVMGCLSERFAKDLAAEIPNVDAYFGSHHLAHITGLRHRQGW